mgnify:CR=1 FL=1
MLKVGLVGVGGISGAHIPAWQSMEDVELVALCDVRPEQMTRYPELRQYTDMDDMLAKEQLDILDICLPTYLHADAAVKAMERGIHVLSEKPVSLKTEDVHRLYETAKRNNVRFMVAQVLRFWPEYVYLKEIYDSGRYGKLLSGRMARLGHMPGWSWDNWMKDESRSGLVPFDLHIHDLDFMVYTFGKPKQVSSFRARRPDQDVFTAVYQFDGFYVDSEATWYAAPYPFHATYRFQFEKALIVLDGALTVYEVDGKTFTVGADGGETGGIELPPTNAYANEIRYFADCVKAGRDADRVKEEELETVVKILRGI